VDLLSGEQEKILRAMVKSMKADPGKVEGDDFINAGKMFLSFQDTTIPPENQIIEFPPPS
jgi:hypothetical protein